MDIAFARALAGGSAAVHAADPHALAAIEGAQAPGWGGYDYARLAHSVDLIEPLRSRSQPQHRDVALDQSAACHVDNVLWRRAARNLPHLAPIIARNTRVDLVGSGERVCRQRRQTRRPRPRSRPRFRRNPAWSRGIVDQQPAAYRPDRSPLFAGEHAGAVDARPARCERRMQRPATQAAELAQRLSSRNFVRAVQHLGLEPRFLTDEAITNGELHRSRLRALMLPCAIALSRREAKRDCGIYRARRRGFFRWRTGAVR